MSGTPDYWGLDSGERRVGTGARVPIYVIHYIYVNVTHCIASTGDKSIIYPYMYTLHALDFTHLQVSVKYESTRGTELVRCISINFKYIVDSMSGPYMFICHLC